MTNAEATQKKENAISTIWNTFIPHPIPNGFFGWEDEKRYEFIEENVYEMYDNISTRDLDKNLHQMIWSVDQILEGNEDSTNTQQTDERQPSYTRWRHGGWYVSNIRYPSGASGCVSNNYVDKKWRIVCDPRPSEEQPTFETRDAAARAERELALSKAQH